MRGRFCFGMQNFHNDNDSKYPYGYIYLSITLIEYKYSYFVIKKAGDVLYRLILQRLVSIVGILLVVTIGTFVLIKLSPIDPVSMKFNLVGATPDPVVVAQIREQLGLNDPWWQQYLRWLGQIVQGDFGESILYALPVATILGGALPNTLGLVSLALVMGVAVTIPLGIVSAKYQDSWIDHGIRLVTFLALAIPGFWVGLLLLYLFGVKLQLVSVTNTNGFSAYVFRGNPCFMDMWPLYSSIAQCYFRSVATALCTGGASIRLARMDGLHPLHIPSCGTYVIAHDGGNDGCHARWVCRY